MDIMKLLQSLKDVSKDEALEKIKSFLKATRVIFKKSTMEPIYITDDNIDKIAEDFYQSVVNSEKPIQNTKVIDLNNFGEEISDELDEIFTKLRNHEELTDEELKQAKDVLEENGDFNERINQTRNVMTAIGIICNEEEIQPMDITQCLYILFGEYFRNSTLSEMSVAKITEVTQEIGIDILKAMEAKGIHEKPIELLILSMINCVTCMLEANEINASVKPNILYDEQEEEIVKKEEPKKKTKISSSNVVNLKDYLEED